MHKNRSENNGWYKCLKPNCQAAFDRQGKLDEHMRIHNNELNKCDYCQFRYVKTSHYKEHLNKHFQIRDYKCDECCSTFTSMTNLNHHLAMHEGITYCCLICKTYESRSKHTMQSHLRKHRDILGEHIIWDSAKEYVKLK